MKWTFHFATMIWPSLGIYYDEIRPFCAWDTSTYVCLTWSATMENDGGGLPTSLDEVEAVGYCVPISESAVIDENLADAAQSFVLAIWHQTDSVCSSSFNSIDQVLLDKYPKSKKLCRSFSDHLKVGNLQMVWWYAKMNRSGSLRLWPSLSNLIQMRKFRNLKLKGLANYCAGNPWVKKMHKHYCRLSSAGLCSVWSVQKEPSWSESFVLRLWPTSFSSQHHGQTASSISCTVCVSTKLNPTISSQPHQKSPY